MTISETSITAELVASEMGLDEQTIRERLQFFGFQADDALLLKDLREYLKNDSGPFVDTLHEAIGHHPETQKILETSRSLEWLKKLHSRYFDEILEGTYNRDYAIDRLSVGITHQRIGLRPQWYMGSFSLYLSWVLPRILSRADTTKEVAGRTLQALLRVVIFDISLAVDAYFHADHEKLRLFSKVFESNIEAVLITDPQGLILHANPMFQKILPDVSGHPAGQNIKAFIDQPPPGENVEPEPFDSIMDLAIRSGSWQGEIQMKRSTGPFPAWMSLSPVGDSSGKTTHMVIEFHDRSEAKAVEEALKKGQEELLRSNRELEQFAYVASHDLQEPLRMVTSYTQLLARRYKDKLSAEADEFIGFAVDGAIRMQSLINALLSYSRVETHGKQFTRVNLNEAVTQALSNLKLALEESKATVDVPTLPTIMGDPIQIMQLFQNLIGNAIKFHSKASPEIRIGVKKSKTEWELTICDNGIGIDPRHYERIFIIFQRLHSKEEYPGTGIGLSLCKKIVERHGGRIWVSSPDKRGTCFHMTFARSDKKKEIHEH